MNTNHCIEICNKLLRGERSAVETYDQAIERLGEHAASAELRMLRDEHSQAVSLLEENVLSMGGQPDGTAGAWGALANAVQGTANILGDRVALESLQRGEEAGKGDYESALGDDQVMPECKSLIESSLLPKVIEHIGLLERLQKAA